MGSVVIEEKYSTLQLSIKSSLRSSNFFSPRSSHIQGKVFLLTTACTLAQVVHIPHLEADGLHGRELGHHSDVAVVLLLHHTVDGLPEERGQEP